MVVELAVVVGAAIASARATSYAAGHKLTGIECWISSLARCRHRRGIPRLDLDVAEIYASLQRNVCGEVDGRACLELVDSVHDKAASNLVPQTAATHVEHLVFAERQSIGSAYREMVCVIKRRDAAVERRVLVIQECVGLNHLREAVVGGKGQAVLRPLLDVNDSAAKVRTSDSLVLFGTGRR